MLELIDNVEKDFVRFKCAILRLILRILYQAKDYLKGPAWITTSTRTATVVVEVRNKNKH